VEESAATDDLVIVGYSAPGMVGSQLVIQQSLERYAREKGWQIITTTSGGDPQQQVNQIEEFIGLGVAAVVAVPDDSSGVCTAVEAADAAGVPFYTIDRSTEGCAINMAVLADNYLAGQQSGEALLAWLTEKYGEPRGTVLEIAGNMAHDVARLRGSGFQDVFADAPDVEIITEIGNWDSLRTEEIVQDILEANADLDAIYMHSDSVSTAGTLAVLEDMDRLAERGEEGHIFLAGVDGSPDALQAIRNGYMDQSSNQPLNDFGIVVDWIEQELNGEPISAGEVTQAGALWSPARVDMTDTGPKLFLGTTSVTEENVDHPGLWANGQQQ
jgi:ABC-type sugar transport system substrate-binding protein